MAHLQDMVQLTVQQVSLSTGGNDPPVPDTTAAAKPSPVPDAAATRGTLLPFVRHSQSTVSPVTVSEARRVPGAITMAVAKESGLVNLSPKMEQSCFQLSLLPASETDRAALTYVGALCRKSLNAAV